MKHLRHFFFSTSMIASVSVFALVFVGTALAIRHGSELGETSVYFMPTPYVLEDQQSSSEEALGKTYGATATAVKYKRCLLTAGHVLQVGVNYVYRGTDLRPENVTSNTERQAIAQSRYSRDFDPTVTANDSFILKNAWNDFAVLWLENRPNPSLGKARIPLGAYNPQQLAKAEEFGLTPISYADARNGLNSPEAPINAFIAGYGQTIGPVPGGPPGYEEAQGAGVKRFGYPRAMQFFYGSGFTIPTVGSIIQTIRDTSIIAGTGTGRIACLGDSGGSLRRQGSSPLYGVVSGIAATGGGIWNLGVLCEDAWVNTQPAFDDVNAYGGMTNWERVNEIVEETCGKSLAVGIVGDGGVNGYFTPQWTDPDGSTLYNGLIDCWSVGSPTYEDCTEFMHEGDALDLLATSAGGWRFKWWGQGSSACPCPPESTTNPCPISYDNLGYYGESISQDTSLCVAEFEQQSSSFSSPPSSSSSSSSAMSFSSSP